MEPCDPDINAKVQILVEMGFPRERAEEVSKLPSLSIYLNNN